MSREEAGRLGGEATAREHGPEFYREIGRKGGETVARERGPGFYSAIGRRGGEHERGSKYAGTNRYNRGRGYDYDGRSSRDRYEARGGHGEGRMSREEAGRLGGETVARERGPGFYSKIGRKGAEARWGEEEGRGRDRYQRGRVGRESDEDKDRDRSNH